MKNHLIKLHHNITVKKLQTVSLDGNHSSVSLSLPASDVSPTA